MYFILLSDGHAHLNLYSVEAYGKANLIEPLPAYPDLVVSVCYTSVCTPRSFEMGFSQCISGDYE